MDLKNAFNGTGYEASKRNPFVLDLKYASLAGNNYLSIDFLTRTMAVRTGATESGLTVVPFSQLDREMLEAMRDKLVALGGKPPELPAERSVTPLPKPRALNP